MRHMMTALWSVGVEGKPSHLRRQIALSNQIGLFAAATAVPYQFFYVCYDFARYEGVFYANLIFTLGYFVVLFLNYRGHHDAARNLVLVNACSQIFVVTYFISAGAGVHLFYFAIAGIMAFLFQPVQAWYLGLQLTVIGALYLISHFAFPAGSTPAPVPSPYLGIMYSVSVFGVLLLSGAFSYLFRRDIGLAEEELTVNNRNLVRLSSTDQLTGLANRRHLDDYLRREWSRMHRESGPLSVLMCDVDHFKQFNDRHGHQAGDACLQKVASVIREVVSRPPDLVARYGGEEFVVVLPGTGEAGARHLGEKIRRAIETLAIPCEASSERRFVTLSVGGTTLDSGHAESVAGASTEHLLKRADEALYQAKEAGRNRFVFRSL